jgi:hypothetical protein
VEPSKNPYGKDFDRNPPRANTAIDYVKKCYVTFESSLEWVEQERLKGNKIRYSLHSLTRAEAETKLNTFLTHHGPCGVCSQLEDLSVYLLKTDLTSPVRRCALKSVFSLGALDRYTCLRELGFTPECSWIWYWNTVNTGKTHSSGGCKSTCMMHWALGTPNNVPVGTGFNPCQPLEEAEGAEERLNAPPESAASSSGAVAACGASGSGSATASSKKKKGHCANTINGKPACHPQMWQDGPARMAACLQCDECRSGPIFQKVAGRTRRASGIRSAIARPDFKPVEHEYI